MSNLRDDNLYIAGILGQTDLFNKQIQLIKNAIDVDPQLTEDERELLASAYKNRISQPRKGIRRLQAIILQEQENLSNGQDTNENRISKLIEFKHQLITEMDGYCEDCINLLNEKLIPNTHDQKALVFYMKMEADYYRYFCEISDDEESKEKMSSKAKECYDKAIEIAKNVMKPYEPPFISLILNYTVFLYEILNQSKEALELSEQTYQESQAIIDQNSEKSRDEARVILQIFQDNITHWKGETNGQ